MSNITVIKTANDDRQGYDVIINKARVSYPYLWKPNTQSEFYNPDSPKLTCGFILTEEDYEVVAKVIAKVANGVDNTIETINDIDRTRRRIKKNEYGTYTLNTSNNENYPPAYIGTDGKVVHDPLSVEADKKLYAGSYARVKIRINASQNKYGAMIWTDLIAIQFIEHGERLGGVRQSDEELQDGFGAVSVSDDLDTVGDDDDFEFNI